MNGHHCIISSLMFLLAVTATSFTVYAQQWEEIGEVVFTDGWISPIYTGKAEKIQVPAQISADGSLVRLMEPYSTACFSDIAGTPTISWGESRNITFDISDPLWVKIIPAEAICLPAGTVNASEQPLWPTSRGEYMHAMGYSREAITKAGLNSVFADMVITIPQGMVAFGTEPGALTQSFSDTPLDITIDLRTASLDTPNISPCVSFTGSEYFTMSGIPATLPLHPGIYIRRTGNSIAKIAVR